MKCIEDEIPFDVPDGWAWERLSNMASFSGGKTPSTSHTEYWGGDTPWITSKDMKSKYIQSSQLLLSDEGAAIMQLYPEGTVLLVVRSGILRHTLPVAILKTKATINQDLKAISLYDNTLNEWIYTYISGSEDRLLLKYKKSGTTVENINFDEFSQIFIPVPPNDEADRILKKCQTVCELINSVKNEKDYLSDAIEITKSKILDLAIRGKLVPQDPSDEPASALLDRIRAEKEELIKQGKLKRDKKESVIFRGDDNSYYMTGRDDPIIMPFEIPQTWEWSNLKELCNYGECENAAPDKIQDDDWILDLEDIEKNTGRILEKHTNAQRKTSSTKHAFDKNDVLYSKLRPYLNKVVLADDKGFCTSEILPLRFKDGIYPKYAQLFLMSKCFVDYANSCSYGMKMPRLGTKDGQLALFAIPPYSEQIHIVNIAEQLNNALITIQDALL